MPIQRPASLLAAGLLALLASACGGGSDVPATGAPPSTAATTALQAKNQAVLGPNALANPGFESGGSDWTVVWERKTPVNAPPRNVILTNDPDWPAYAGSGVAVLGGSNSVLSSVAQAVRVPDNAPRAGLQFRYVVSAQETPANAPNDALRVEVIEPVSGTLLATLGTITSLDRSANPFSWQLSPVYDLTAYRGQTVLLKFSNDNNPMNPSAFGLDDIHLGSLDVRGIDPQTGWWWNANQPGRGFAIERQGDKIFVAGFLYEEAGPSSWYTATLQRQAGGAFTGALQRHTGGQTLQGDFRPTNGTQTVATASLVVVGEGQATLSVAPADGGAQQAIALERFAFGGLAPSAVQFASGWWWNPAEPGRGYFIEAQGSQLFAASFMYRDDGQPVWYAQQGALATPTGYAFGLREYRGGQTLFGGWRANTQVAAPGTLTLSTGSAASGTLAFPGGRTVPVQRFLFNTAAEDTLQP